MWRLIACSNGAMSLLVVCFVCFLFFQKIVDSHSALYPHSCHGSLAPLGVQPGVPGLLQGHLPTGMGQGCA